MGTINAPQHDPADLVVTVLRDHAASVLRLARRHSLCADDAEDAYQRAVEIFLRRADRLTLEGAPSWLRTVVKHEAMAVRENRQRLLDSCQPELDSHEATRLQTSEEQVESFDLLSTSAEALQRLKPHEVRAILLKAQGHSYREIADLTGWSYTKVNRLITEGRRSFLQRYASIESGQECSRWEPLLSALADGEASAQDMRDLRPHLRNCPACRATLAVYRESPSRVAAVLPVALALAPAAGSEGPGVLTRIYEGVVGAMHERATLAAHKAQLLIEGASATKVAAVTASAAALAGGGVAVTDAVTPPQEPARAGVDDVRAEAVSDAGTSSDSPALGLPGLTGLLPATTDDRGTGPAGADPSSAEAHPLRPAAAGPAPSSPPPPPPPPPSSAREFSFEHATTPAPAASGTPSPQPAPVVPEFGAGTGSHGGGSWEGGGGAGAGWEAGGRAREFAGGGGGGEFGGGSRRGAGASAGAVGGGGGEFEG